jgi:hypothetical protein
MFGLASRTTIHRGDRAITLVLRGGASVAMLIGCLAMAGFSFSQDGDQPVVKRGGGIGGLVMCELPEGAGEVFVNDLELFLLDSNLGHVLTSVKTDRFGRFAFPRQEPGAYTISWGGAGWEHGVCAESISIESETVHVAPIIIRPTNPKQMRAVYGKVRMADGGMPYFYDEFFGVQAESVVQIRDLDDQMVASTRVNAYGEFIAVGLPLQTLRVRASFENALSMDLDVPERSRNAMAVLPVLELQNRAPRILELKAVLDSQAVTYATTGASVRCITRSVDQDGHPLAYTWKNASLADSLRPNGETADWSLSKTSGSYSSYVLVADGFGGYATGQLSLAVGGKSAPIARPKFYSAPPAPAEFLTRKRTGEDAVAAGYYATIDPQNKRSTLGDWWAINGFQSDGTSSTETKIVYLNDNDLGFGREMHFVKSGSNVAAYVTNYGGPDQHAENADDASTGTNPKATVCMEYSPIEGQKNPIVKFFVYDVGKTAASSRQKFADLDGHGNKFVPNLCMNCHGGAGSYIPRDKAHPTLAEVDLGASFREFDVATYKFARPGKPSADPSRITPTPGELKTFHDLNNLVVATNPAAGIQDIISGWYAGGNDDQLPYVPSGWSASNDQKSLYTTVVGTSCRTCHVAFGSSTANTAVNWQTFTQFGTYNRVIKKDVLCGATLFMPHAQITFDNFWFANPSKAEFLRNFETLGWAKLGTCP